MSTGRIRRQAQGIASSWLDRSSSSSLALFNLLHDIGFGTATARPGSTLGRWSAGLILLWWWSDKSEIDIDGLVKELCLVRLVDGAACLVESWVFDESVTLNGGG